MNGEGPGGGKLNGCIMHRVHTSWNKHNICNIHIGSPKKNWIKGVTKLDWRYSKCNAYMAFTKHTLGFFSSNVYLHRGCKNFLYYSHSTKQTWLIQILIFCNKDSFKGGLAQWTTILLVGENTVKGTKGVKVKVLFQRLHMTHVIFVLVYNLTFCILGTPFNIIFWLQIDFISCILCNSCLLSHEHE